MYLLQPLYFIMARPKGTTRSAARAPFRAARLVHRLVNFGIKGSKNSGKRDDEVRQWTITTTRSLNGCLDLKLKIGDRFETLLLLICNGVRIRVSTESRASLPVRTERLWSLYPRSNSNTWNAWNRAKAQQTLVLVVHHMVRWRLLLMADCLRKWSGDNRKLTPRPGSDGRVRT